MFWLGNVWLVLLRIGFMFLRTKKNRTKLVLVLLCSCFFRIKTSFKTGFTFLLGNVWLVLLRTGFMFLRTKKKRN